MRRSFRKTLWNPLGKANADYQMIHEGDRIAIGVSGGKDSSTLLYLLAELRRFSPVKYQLEAITLDLGWEADLSSLEEFCREIQVPLHIEKTMIGPIIFEHRQEKNPCSLCGKMRRGALYNVAKNLGCNKVALAHHLDDAIETLFMSMFYEGRIRTFLPKMFSDRKQITLIRPMVYIREESIKKAVDELGLPVVHNPCPINGYTKRQEMKELISFLAVQNPLFHERMLTALQNVDTSHFWKQKG